VNLISGAIMTHEQSLAALNRMSESICRTLSAGGLPVERVITACDALSKKLTQEACLPALLALGIPRERALREIAQAKAMLSREYIEARLLHEFGEIPGKKTEFVPFDKSARVVQVWKPLGVLFHIAAGNVDALPLLSVIEGLLTGNINLLKLPGNDDGLSTSLLRMLIEAEPRLAEYIYVFHLPSTDAESIKKMLAVSDAAAVWGSDFAVSGIRADQKASCRARVRSGRLTVVSPRIPLEQLAVPAP
jgi:acyl-CoA reductase-like NAD-dependent aldehyde dehydrogenase